jgi:hypothetical protein
MYLLQEAEVVGQVWAKEEASFRWKLVKSLSMVVLKLLVEMLVAMGVEVVEVV